MALRKATEQQIRQVLVRLVEARSRAGLTQAQASRLLGFTNSNASISRYESGAKELPVGVMLQLAEIYDVDPTWLLTGVNVNFDAQEWLERIDNASGQVRVDLENILELLQSLRTGSAQLPLEDEAVQS